MKHVSTFTLLLITLLQLCLAELSGSWFSANVINDGDFSPKPISEIFSTESPFSPTNPIVVLPPSSTTMFSSTTQLPPLSSITTNKPTSEFVSSTPSTYPTQKTSLFPSSTYGSSNDLPKQSTLAEPKPTFDLRQPFPFPFPQDKQQPNAPNYFLIYQQAPQSLQSLSPSAPQQTFPTIQPSTGFEVSTIQPDLSSPLSTFSTFQPELSTPQSTFSTLQPELSSPLTTFSTFRPETSTLQSTLATFQPSSDSTFPSNLPISPTTRMPSSTPSSDQTLRTTRTVVSCNTSQPSVASQLSKFPTLRIRMVAPSGSITNINLNPVVATTTKRSTTRRTTTTRRPTTTKTRRTRRNRNSFDGCINACTGRSPICASPLAVTPIDPDRLKGFPSICHMACHNSFKKEQYEMLVDGRCGRLRTRIQTVDSNKLKRVELNKAQYTVVGNPQTVVEFSSLPR